MSDRNIRTLKSDKPPSSPPKEADPPKKPPKKEKRESPKPKPEPVNGVKPGNELRKRNLVEQTKKPDENMQIKPMQDEVSTCHSRCVTWAIDANLRTFFFLEIRCAYFFDLE